MSRYLRAKEARDIINRAMAVGLVGYNEPYILIRFRERNLGPLDAINVLERGVVSDATRDEPGKPWRHRVATTKITVVIEIIDEQLPEIKIITIWRNGEP